MNLDEKLKSEEIERVRKKGERNKSIEITRKLLDMDVRYKKISEITGLTEKEVKNIDLEKNKDKTVREIYSENVGEENVDKLGIDKSILNLTVEEHAKFTEYNEKIAKLLTKTIYGNSDESLEKEMKDLDKKRTALLSNKKT